MTGTRRSVEMARRPSLPVDPRIRRRRAEVLRSEGRRRLGVLVAAVSLTVLAGAGWAATRSPLLDVDRIAVTGTREVPPNEMLVGEILAAANVRRGAAMIDLDERAAAQRTRALPWVKQARVTRRWPGTVVIDVVERTPVAVAAGPGGGFAVVDETGAVMREVAGRPQEMLAAGRPQEMLAAGRPQEILVLEGIGPAGPPGTALAGQSLEVVRVAAAVPPAVRQRTDAVISVAGGGIDLRLRDPANVRVRLGSPGPDHELMHKFMAIEAVLAGTTTSDVTVLDVRIPQSPAITRRKP